MQDTQQGRPGVHTRRSGKPFRVYLSDERVPNAFQGRDKFVLKTRLRIERVARVKHREQVVEYIAILLSGDVRESLHRYIILGALQPTNDILSHLGLVLTITERAGFLEGLNSSRRKCAGPTSPQRAPARAPTCQLANLLPWRDSGLNLKKHLRSQRCTPMLRGAREEWIQVL